MEEQELSSSERSGRPSAQGAPRSSTERAAPPFSLHPLVLQGARQQRRCLPPWLQSAKSVFQALVINAALALEM